MQRADLAIHLQPQIYQELPLPLVLSLVQKTETEAYQKSLIYLQKMLYVTAKYYSLYYTAQAMFRGSPELWNE